MAKTGRVGKPTKAGRHTGKVSKGSAAARQPSTSSKQGVNPITSTAPSKASPTPSGGGSS